MRPSPSLYLYITLLKAQLLAIFLQLPSNLDKFIHAALPFLAKKLRIENSILKQIANFKKCRSRVLLPFFSPFFFFFFFILFHFRSRFYVCLKYAQHTIDYIDLN